MFKRRKPRSYSQLATQLIYPRGGWRRASQYVMHRIRRLPDQPQRIARGFAAGIFVSFTPLFGFHFMVAALVAWLIRGNIFASLLATFVGNPLTFPFIAVVSLSLGRWMLGVEGKLQPNLIFEEFSRAARELWNNLLAPLTDAPVGWNDFGSFWDGYFLPYAVGGIIPGLVAAAIGHYLTLPLIRAYHKRRARKMADRIARVREQQAPAPSAPPDEASDEGPDKG
ncbi:hypothetical protein SAMN04487972_11424 [Paracoccus halophilus]|uniref:DUF2062 domain-containing protein n=1 Tax=Paracoccus halophilus TaxID=376733 RepID=A0A099F1X1_9RHOB|nr:DUF2062 domain-containing protein [Paracoccus halophilus]KGJ04152.1 hypothetical protein IT41_11630 [Paracoccus halophilus]SFA55722.1 hypothetical protein SAMN04487972_11424 [Paracoccus halophilus]